MNKTLIILIGIFSISCSHNPMLTKSENQLRRIIADMQVEIDNQKEEISKLTGKIEESEHRLDKKFSKQYENVNSEYAVLKAKIELLEAYDKNQNEINKRMVEAIQENENRIITIDKNYKNFRKKKRTDKNIKKDLELATKYYEEKKYRESRKIYLEYLNQPDLLTLKEYRVYLYRVALSEYRLNMNDDAIAHFSQLYQKFYKEDDKYMASSLYHIAALLVKDKKCEDARSLYNQIKANYPTHEYFNKMANRRLYEINTSSWCKSHLF